MKVRLQTPPNPDPGRLTFYIDQAKKAQQKDPAGAVLPTGGLSGDPISLEEAATPATDADGVWLYSKDVGGITEFFVLDGDGNEIQVTNAGALNPAITGGSGQFWPTQVGRTSFDAGLTPVSNQFTVNTGILLAPPPGQASLFHFRVTTGQVTVGAGGLYYFCGWVAFTDNPGTPDVRLNKQFMASIPGFNSGVISADFNALPNGAGCSVLPTGELVLHFYAASGDNWLAGNVAVTSMLLPANLTPPPA